MIKSMTGYGRGENEEAGRKFLVEIKTVNHRYSDISVRLPRQISYLEEYIRAKCTAVITRGKADIYITYDDFSEDSKQVLVDKSLVKAYLNACLFIKEEYGLENDITVSKLSRFPEVMKVEKGDENEEIIRKILESALDKALKSLLKMRAIEGEKLKDDMDKRLYIIETELSGIEKRAPGVVEDYRQKLTARINELMEQKIVDENRLAMEVAVFSDRCSIDEEIVRLKSHIQQVRDTLELPEASGKKFDFIVQEMNREINTIGSKANDLEITKRVVDVKSELEKIREQVQNIE